MRRPWRFTEIGQKALYIVVGWVVMAVGFYALRTWVIDSSSLPYELIGMIANATYTLVGVRTFRGYLEPVAPPRPWWRWTGRPRAGYWLGALQLIAALGTIQEFWPRDDRAANVPGAILELIGAVPIGILYLNSSIRLSRNPESWSKKRPRHVDALDER